MCIKSHTVRTCYKSFVTILQYFPIINRATEQENLHLNAMIRERNYLLGRFETQLQEIFVLLAHVLATVNGVLFLIYE